MGSLNAHTFGLPLQTTEIMRLIPKNSKQAYRASLVLTLISFTLFALGIRFDDTANTIVQVVFPAWLPFLLRETFRPMGNDY